VAAAALVALFRRLESDGASGKPGLRLAALPQTLRQMARAERDPSDGTAPKAVQTPAHWLKLALVGLLMLILAYPLTFTTTPVALVGRGTRVHFAGVVGAGLLWAGLGELALAIGRGYRLAGWVRLAMALVFGLSLSYDLSVQRDYARAWTLERTFWQGVLPLAPDIQDRTMVLVGGTPLPETLQIGANTWALPRILGEMFIFPADWRTLPRVYRLVPDWQAAIPSGADRFRLDGNVVIRPPWLVAEAVPSNTILLQRGADGRLSRLTSVDIGSRTYDLKPKGVSSLTSHPTTPLYHLLMDDSDMSGDR
jgi:hypothetical protein